MTPRWQASASQLAADLQRIFGNRLHSVVAYGARLEGRDDAPLTCLALVGSLEAADLAACGRVSTSWARVGIATPLVLPAREFRRSLDTFPLEYGEIMRAHAKVLGDDPFAGLSIARTDLRRACETQVASHLVHLREGYIEAGGNAERIAALIVSSAPAFLALLRHVAHLDSAEATALTQSAHRGARAAGIPEGLVADFLMMESPSGMPAADPARLFPNYLAAVEHLAQAVDTWPV